MKLGYRRDKALFAKRKTFDLPIVEPDPTEAEINTSLLQSADLLRRHHLPNFDIKIGPDLPHTPNQIRNAAVKR
ncbi:hypothetical protein RsS62_09110 [Rhizobium dioscoreae]|nr:hypothetical protein RsS62_09110 [Rhizobium dioscoreae]